MVTHYAHLAPLADRVVLMERGRIFACGSFAELQARGVDMAHFAGADHAPAMEAEAAAPAGGAGEDPARLLAADFAGLRLDAAAADASGAAKGAAPAGETASEETMEAGAVRWRTYAAYALASAGSPWAAAALWALIAAFVLLSQAAAVSSDYYLAYWANQVPLAAASRVMCALTVAVAARARVCVCVRAPLRTGRRAPTTARAPTSAATDCSLWASLSATRGGPAELVCGCCGRRVTAHPRRRALLVSAATGRSATRLHVRMLHAVFRTHQARRLRTCRKIGALADCCPRCCRHRSASST
jgi:hypothetical protein